jgi:glycosyltransferase involved in cell wall biosynthesis
MHYCNPVKAREYLAMGKPVVSVPIPEVVETMGDVVAIATSPSEFLEKVEWELVNDCPERREARIQKVSSETWESRMEEISRLVEFFLKGK